MNRGDIFHVNLDPIERREQAGARYVPVVSTLICPITQGCIFCSQPRVFDLEAHNARLIEKVLDFIMVEVLSKLSAILE